MTIAYEFREQCLKMDETLKTQLSLFTNHENLDNEAIEVNECGIEDDTSKESMKKLAAIIKNEPMDDDDCYYVLVIDNPDEETSNFPSITNIKQEEVEDLNTDSHIDESDKQNEETQKQFENCVDSFLISKPIVSTTVPDTILENEEGHENEIDFETIQGNFIDEPSIIHKDDSAQPLHEVKDLKSNNFLKIITPTGVEKTIWLQNASDIKYITDSQEADDNEESGEQEEIVFYEDDEQQLQILKCEGSELVIEYADEDQIATVIQQEDGTFLCDCGESFKDLVEYQNHQYKHNPAGDNLCNKCGKGFETPEILAGHMQLHKSTSTLVECQFCNKYIKRSALTHHIKFVHSVKPKCTICDKTFANQNNLKRHMMIHRGIKEFECDICMKRFNQKITMQTHRLTHLNSTTCSVCDTMFEDRASLVIHRENNGCTNASATKVKDDLLKAVKREITTNDGKLLGYACSLCKKMFSIESALEQHVEKVHIIETLEEKKINKQMKRFECKSCGKNCASQAMLVMHERVHTNERPFPCQLCTLKFKTKTHLRTHQLTHTREKKFGCSVCMKFFALKGNLVVHLRTHTGERPYVCSICDEAFIDSKYLKKHKLRKHAIENVPWNQY
ncbi:zinc finger protein 33A-like isoform X2 [Leptidea sinapis]|nr:zinc finger protein 33A-like isoform X2 [Leptidea sinapis]XP_050673101.1 zinc finger protein 33A-like isoform X2 [Leptidea sinapis]